MVPASFIITSETENTTDTGGNQMRENLTELVFILDRSGSMGGLETDTIGGFNAMLDKQRKEEGEAVISTVLFNSESEVIHDRVPIKEVKNLTDKEYYVGGGTALLDAVGGAIHHIANVHKYAREEDRPAKTLFVITTDGYENSSRRYSFDRIKKMIGEKQEKNHWEFIFLGANIDAVDVAGSIGISRSHAANFHNDAMGTALNYTVLEKAVSRVRRCKVAEVGSALSGGDWKEEIDEDFRKRDVK